MCYRVAVATGLRYGELATITRASIDVGEKGSSVAVDASETKNGESARQPLPKELGDDLEAFIAHLPEGVPIFGLPPEKGAKMLRFDLRAAGIPYQDAAGRYGELATITRASIDVGEKGSSVAVDASETKNGESARQPLPKELGDDLEAFIAHLPEGVPIFGLPPEKGAKMLRFDLRAAGIPYQDAAGRFFDFHSLRCETATLADAAGVSPRVVQRLMRHSSLELTGRYTRPREEELEAAAGMIPSIKPSVNKIGDDRPAPDLHEG